MSKSVELPFDDAKYILWDKLPYIDIMMMYLLYKKIHLYIVSIQ